MAKSAKLYIFLFSACMVGMVWLIWNLADESSKNSTKVEACLIKKVTGVPCPSCGTTRSTMSIFKGKMKDAFNYNPFGFIVSGALIAVPIWIIFDFISRKQTFYKAYRKAESILTIKYVYIPLIALVVLNWIWNIFKYLK